MQPKPRDPQQPRATRRLAALLKPSDPAAAQHRRLDDITAELRTMTAAQLLTSERTHRAAGNLGLAAAALVEIERRAKSTQ